MSNHKWWIKIVALGLIVLLFNQVFAGTAYALSEGPSQPEALQFEPVDTVDLVNLATGDFVYTLPLLEVPGPHGSYPLVLSYHAGIGPNQEATMVGLGWSLNPGAINRSLNGYPDDFNGASVQTHYEGETKSVWGISLSLGYGPVGVNLDYISNKGFLGPTSISLGIPIGESGFVPGLRAGEGGIGFSLRYGQPDLSSNESIWLTSGHLGGVSVDRAHNGKTTFGSHLTIGGTDVNMNTRTGVSVSIGGVGFSASTQSSGGTTRSLSLPVFMIPPFTAFYREWAWSLNETFLERAYGFFNWDAYMAMSSEKKFERQLQGKYIYTSQDFYSVNAQGLSGNIVPYKDTPFRLRDREDHDKKAYLELDWDSYAYSTSSNQIFFRFLNEGSNFVTQDGQNGNPRWGSQFETISSSLFGSRITVPVLNEERQINGFDVTDSDGKVYEFREPVDNSFHYTAVHDPVSNIENYTTFETNYASNWLLSSIKGPDYVDRGNPGFSEEDWGYWVKFVYTNFGVQMWRAPFEGVQPGEQGKVNSWSVGTRDMILLTSVESSTHVAKLNMSPALDRRMPDNVDNIKIHPYKLKGNKYYFIGNWVDELADIPLGDNVLDVSIKGDCIQRGGITYASYTLKRGTDFTYTYDPSINSTIITDNIMPSSWQVYIPGSQELCTAYLVGPIGVTPLHPELNFVPGSLAQKLDRIDLFNKSDLSKPIRTVNLSYDYYLCPNTPNSTSSSIAGDGADKGKLTLRQVNFLGQKDPQSGLQSSILPPYRFEYAYGNVPGTGLNPGFHADDWDNWGSYKDPNSGRGLFNHTTPQNKSMADKATAWSLTKVTTPTGGEIHVEYESDDYFHVSNSYDFHKAAYQWLDPSLQTPDQSINYFIVPNLQSYNLAVGQDIILTTDIYTRSYCDYQCSQCTETRAFSGAKYQITGLDLIANKVTLDQNIFFSSTNVSGQCNEGVEYQYAFCASPRIVYGGGIRVKNLTVTDGYQAYTTTYTYRDGNFSSGVATSLPAPYFENKDTFLKDLDHSIAELKEYLKVYMDHELSYGRPSPAVLYSNVEVAKTNGDGNSISGKEVYEFYTGYDFPYQAVDENGILTITDKSSIYGKPKSVVYFEQVDDQGTQLRKVMENNFAYAFSGQLSSEGKTYYYNQDVTSPNKPLGLIQEKYKFRNKYGSGSNDVLERFVDKQIHNVYLLNTKSTQYYYDSPTTLTASRNAITERRTFMWDALSGSAIAEAGYDSKGKAEITRSMPAYWKYRDELYPGFGMDKENMLTQVCQETVYRSNVDQAAGISGLLNYTFPSMDIVSSLVSTWSNLFDIDADGVISNDEKQSWRKNDAYEYNSKVDHSDGVYSDFNRWNDLNPENPNDRVSSSFPWKLTSDVTRYNRFSHVTERKLIDNTYTATLYGHKESIPVAIVTNAKVSDIFFASFEEGISEWAASSSNIQTTSDSRTGINSMKVLKDDAGSFATATRMLSQGTYEMTVWFKTISGLPGRVSVESGGNTLAIAEAIGSGGWQLLRLKFAQPTSSDVQIKLSTEFGTSGIDYVLYDDVRLHPVDANMTTYTYDPLTWNLTSITNVNLIPTYYEYDLAGRLVSVKDQNRNLIKRVTYHYQTGN